MRLLRPLIAAVLMLLPIAAKAQGTLPLSLTQQFSFVGCSSAANVCGTPLAAGLLYFYQVGTVASPQNSYQDTGLTILNPWPLTLDANGRVPPFYLANGSIHVRLTDASGVVQFDYPNVLVIGPSGGSGGAAVDPTTISSTGDIKYRATGETVSGWVKANGQTIGSPTSGATGRANNDTQNLFIYLWTNCPDAHCPVVGGRGATAAADFSANKQITLFDFRGRIPFGLDDMGNSAAGRLLNQNMSGVGDLPTTPNGIAGEANHTITQAQIPSYSLSLSTSISDTRTWGVTNLNAPGGSGQLGSGAINWASGGNQPVGVTGGSITASTTGSSGGSGTTMNVINNSILGSWYVKL